TGLGHPRGALRRDPRRRVHGRRAPPRGDRAPGRAHPPHPRRGARRGMGAPGPHDRRIRGDPVTTTVPTPLAPVAAWPSLREMAAPVAQQTFHVLMEAFSLPGTLRTLPADPAAGPIPAAVAPLRALADLMTPVT